MIDRNVRRCFGVHQPTLPESPARQERGENRQPDNPRSCRPRQINDRSQENKGNPSSSNQLMEGGRERARGAEADLVASPSPLGIRQTGASAFVPLGTHHLIDQPSPRPERAQMLRRFKARGAENDRRLKRREEKSARPPVRPSISSGSHSARNLGGSGSGEGGREISEPSPSRRGLPGGFLPSTAPPPSSARRERRANPAQFRRARRERRGAFPS